MPKPVTYLRRDVLGGSDYSLISATEGKQGIEIAMFCEPDVILLDLHLTDIYGGDVLKRLRGISNLQPVPVIAVTADAMHGDRERILEMGFDGYVAKPVSRFEILPLCQNR